MSLRLLPEAYEALCKAILQRDGYRCRSCGSRNALHVHHIVFRSQSGPDEAWNLIVLCNSCHTGLHVDVREGVMGLAILLPADANGVVQFVRNWGWKPI